MKVPLLKRWLSYLWPVRVKTFSSPVHPVLELFLYREQWQLGTPDALYSDGHRYRPLAAAYKRLEAFMPGIRNMLVLGGGLGSALYLLQKAGWQPEVVLVEKDPEILRLALELMPEGLRQKLIPVNADAAAFMDANERSYDCIVIDIFDGRVVPPFVMQEPFLQRCAEKLRTSGALVLNYMINDQGLWEKDRSRFLSVFGQCDILDLGINRVLIARV